MAGFMLLCEIKARQRIRLETILPALGSGLVTWQREQVYKCGRPALPKRLTQSVSAEALHVWARIDLLMIRICAV